MPDAQGRATNLDFAAVPLDLSHLPEFAFSKHGPRYLSRTACCDRCGNAIHEKRGERKHFLFEPHETPSGYRETWCIDCADAHNRPPQGPMVPATLRPIGPRPMLTQSVVVRENGRDRYLGEAAVEGKADPTWDTAFAIKFTRKKPTNETPLVLPLGAVAPSDRHAELDFLIATQGDELATDYDTFVANGIEATRLDATIVANDDWNDAANSAARRPRTRPDCIRLPDEQVTTPDGRTVTVERYGDAGYIANMRRRIDWERWMDQCSSIDRAFFDPKSPKGDIGIAAMSKSRDKEFLLALRRLVKTRWLETHSALPDVDDIVQVIVRVEGTRILDVIEPDEHRRLRDYWADIDDDPDRVAHHADPDPKPLRDHYAFTECEDMPRRPHSRWAKSDDPIHNGCAVDGWNLYRLDMALWEHREELAGRIGYAGPSGLLGTEAKSTKNHFLREEEVDDFEYSA